MAIHVEHGRENHKKRKLSGTVSTKKHRFESFNRRIENIDINPIRRRLKPVIDAQYGEIESSFFVDALQRAKGMCFTPTFNEFLTQVNPLASTLAQVVHHRARIFEVTKTSIAQNDTHCLEFLLDLLSQLAHDLGPLFDEYMVDAVESVISIAIAHSDVSVIEWSFKALTWLFHYLSRLLIADLKPIYGLFAPLLGNMPQKPYLARFAAEALAYLVRKAATKSIKNEALLQNCMQAIEDDIAANQRKIPDLRITPSYKLGLTLLMLNSIIGINYQLHSHGLSVYESLLDRAVKADQHLHGLSEILYATTIALVHRTNAAGLKPILECVLIRIIAIDKVGIESQAGTVLGRVLFLLCATRKGTRITLWEDVSQACLKLLRHHTSHDSYSMSDDLKAASAILQLAPLPVVEAEFGPITQAILHWGDDQSFLLFCNHYYLSGQDRFHTFLSPYLSSFVAEKWQAHTIVLLQMISEMYDGSWSQRLVCPPGLESHVLSIFESLGDKAAVRAECLQFVGAAQSLLFSDDFREKLRILLQSRILNCIKDSRDADAKAFWLGPVLHFYVSQRSFSTTDAASIWPGLCRSADSLGLLTSYLQAMCLIAQVIPGEIDADCTTILETKLIQNLYSPSPDVRRISLALLMHMQAQGEAKYKNALQAMTQIEELSKTFQQARTASMYIRRLPSIYQGFAHNPTTKSCLIYFCFGMLTYRLASARDDAIAVLKDICADREGKTLISDLVFAWLQSTVIQQGLLEQEAISSPREVSLESLEPDFDCSNVNKLEETARKVEADVANPAERAKAHFILSRQYESARSVDARMHALDILVAIPELAEQNSPKFVPFFLAWANTSDQPLPSEIRPPATCASNPENSNLSHDWPLKARKACLKALAQFKTPQSMFKANEVFHELEHLLCHGDPEMQSAALKGIFAWRKPELLPHHEKLLNMLDDARLREELTSLHASEETQHGDAQVSQRSLMSITVRLLFGKMVSKTGRSAGKSDRGARRKAILLALCKLGDDPIAQFVHIAVGQLRTFDIRELSDPATNTLIKIDIAPRLQVGALKVVKTMLEVIGSRLEMHLEHLIKVPLYSLVQFSDVSEDEHIDSVVASKEDRESSSAKTIRSLSLACLVLMAQKFEVRSMNPYIRVLFAKTLSLRLEKLASETSQAVSGILRLFATWATSPVGVSYLTDYDERAIVSVSDCLTQAFCKTEVRLFVMNEFLSPLLSSARSLKDVHRDDVTHDAHAFPGQRVFELASEAILRNLYGLLSSTSDKNLIEAGVSLLQTLALEIEQSAQAREIVEISMVLLTKPPTLVSPVSKGKILRTLTRFLPSAKAHLDMASTQRLSEVLSGLFGYFKDRENRLALSDTFLVFATGNAEIQVIAQLCKDLNAFSTLKAGEPDFDTRIKAYNNIQGPLAETLTTAQWAPLLEIALFYFKDEDEMVLRANSVEVFKRFVDAVILARKTERHEMAKMLEDRFLPKIRKGAHERSEIVRAEFLSSLAYVVQYDLGCSGTRDLEPLLAGNDEEASFFNNILHIQQHRRIRAVRRLVQYAEVHTLSALNVSQFLIPLLEHFIFDSGEDQVASSLAQESIVTIGRLCTALEWSQFRAIFARYCTYLDQRQDHVKSVMRLLGVLSDALRTASDYRQPSLPSLHSEKEESQPTVSLLAASLPERSILSRELNRNMLPKMTTFIHQKDESVVSLRAPISIAVVKLLQVLPSDELQRALPPLLTDLCNILRSRAQESRDLTRKTLADISVLIGPNYFGFLLNELRTALTRGYQLHVLSFTVHTILLELSHILQAGDLDPYVGQIVSIVIEDTFGKAGQEKEAEDYISKMREVKSSKAFDTMELVASLSSVSQVSHITSPIKLLFDSRLNLHALRKLDELLRRLELGLLRNDQAYDQRILMLCYELFKDASRPESKAIATAHQGRRPRTSEQRSGKKITVTASEPSLMYKQKITRFAFSLLRAMLRKHKALKTPANLHSWVPILGEALMSDEEIQVPALRLLLEIVDLPIEAFEQNVGVYVAECVRLIKNAASTDVEASQAAYKLVAALLRDKTANGVRPGDVAYLVKRLVPELEQPDKQGGAFNFLKAVMSRKIMIPEIYEIHDEIARIMVTNHTKTARDTARASYIHFVLNYPQTRERYMKQLAFLIQNLNYQYIEGRQSVMEALHIVFTKAPTEFAGQAMQQSYLSLIMILVNDESEQCREMSGTLLRTMLERADPIRKKALLDSLRSWLDSEEDLVLQRAALQVFGLALEATSTHIEEELKFLMPKLLSILQSSNGDPLKADWELTFYAIQLISRSCEKLPHIIFDKSQTNLWIELRRCLDFPHNWVKMLASKLLGAFYSDIARSLSKEDRLALPLSGSYNLQLDEEGIRETLQAFLGLIESGHSSSDLADQCVRNLLFLGNMMRRTDMSSPDTIGDDSVEHEASEHDATEHGSEQESNDPRSIKKASAFISLVLQLSRILREPPTASNRPALQPLRSSLQLLGAFVTRMETLLLKQWAGYILIPLYSLTDPNVPRPFSTDPGFTEDYESIGTNSSDLMSKIQEKLGTQDYLAIMQQVRERAKEKREARRTKRAIDRVAYPERAGREKKKKNEKKRERRKEKQSDYRAKRQAV